MILLADAAFALTLAEAVQRAAEVDPNAVVAELAWQQTQLDAAEAWVQLGLTPTFAASRRIDPLVTTDRVTLDLAVGALDPYAWFAATQRSSVAGSARYAAAATMLDAQYAAATLFYSSVLAQDGVEGAREGERIAKATLDATTARVAAGLESELAGRSARLSLLEAEATTAETEAALAIARASLARALQQELGALEAPGALPELPRDATESPWLSVARADVTAARFEEYANIAEIFPTGTLAADSNLPFDTWGLTLGVSWTFDGLAGPFLRARHAALARTIAEVQLDALERDQELALLTAKETARAARRVAEAARARVELAAESLNVGQVRLSMGMASSLEVLRLQDDAAKARADRVDAELVEATARLEALRVGGVAW